MAIGLEREIPKTDGRERTAYDQWVEEPVPARFVVARIPRVG